MTDTKTDQTDKPKETGRRTQFDIVPRFVKTPDAAAYLGFSPRTLEKHRCFGTGPRYYKLGGRVVYATKDLDAWAEVGMRQSTSDPGAGTVLPAKRVATSRR